MSSPPVILIFGAGPNVGAALVSKFLDTGYRVATVSRSAAEPAQPSPDGKTLAIRADLGDETQVHRAFSTVKDVWAVSPTVVVWNVFSVTPSPDPDNIFSIPLDALNRDVAITATSAFAAAGEAVKGWTADGLAGRFILTGNILAKVALPDPFFISLGVGKAGAAFWLGAADELYKSKNWRFFYADERTAEGKSVGFVPEAKGHATMYLQLAQGDTSELPSYVTFVDGKFREFP